MPEKKAPWRGRVSNVKIDKETFNLIQKIKALKNMSGSAHNQAIKVAFKFYVAYLQIEQNEEKILIPKE